MINVENRPRWVLFALLAIALAAVPIASGGPERGTGSLALQAALNVAGFAVTCPPGVPPETDFCTQRDDNGRVPGLGFVTASYLYLVDENAGCGGDRVLESTAEIKVPGKGAIQFDLAPLEQCLPDLGKKANQPFTVIGGSGVYAGATGSGTVNHDVYQYLGGAAGTDTWVGSLVVPGLEFDLTPPTLNGLVNKTARTRKGAKRVRVKYRVTAQDLGDGSMPAKCEPRSGSRFKIGRTVVKCSATDTSANTATGSFRVVVKRHP